MKCNNCLREQSGEKCDMCMGVKCVRCGMPIYRTQSFRKTPQNKHEHNVCPHDRQARERTIAQQPSARLQRPRKHRL